MTYLTQERLLERLRKAQGNRTQQQFARELGISPAYLCDVLKRRRAPGKTILQHFGLVAETIYREVLAKEGK